jgi:hypothetical protein
MVHDELVRMIHQEDVNMLCVALDSGGELLKGWAEDLREERGLPEEGQVG